MMAQGLAFFKTNGAANGTQWARIGVGHFHRARILLNYDQYIGNVLDLFTIPSHNAAMTDSVIVRQNSRALLAKCVTAVRTLDQCFGGMTRNELPNDNSVIIVGKGLPMLGHSTAIADGMAVFADGISPLLEDSTATGTFYDSLGQKVIASPFLQHNNVFSLRKGLYLPFVSGHHVLQS